MKLPAALIAIAALAGLSACNETQSVANQWEKTGSDIGNAAETIEADTANAIDATENALDENARALQNQSVEVNVSVSNKQ